MEAFENLLSEPAGSTRAIWTQRLASEEAAPQKRIIHCRYLNAASPFALRHLGLRAGRGYTKCGSAQETDWITSCRVLVWQSGRWRVCRELREIPLPQTEDEIRWFELNEVASSVRVEVRRAQVDGWWPSWSLDASGVLLTGDLPQPARAPQRLLEIESCDLRACASGVEAQRNGMEVRFRTRFLEVGFQLGRAGWSYLALDEMGEGSTQRNLLRRKAEWRNPWRESCVQGTRLHAVGDIARAGFWEHDFTGSVAVRGSTVTYILQQPDAGLSYLLRWNICPDRMELEVERRGEYFLRAWASSAWHVAFDAGVTQTTALGKITREGESGIMELPVLLHAPGCGTLQIKAATGHALWRSDALRPIFTTTGELKIGEAPQENSDYELASGSFRETVEMKLAQHRPKLARSTPAVVRRAVQRCSATALSYRADTATLSNNGISIHAPLCMDNWSALLEHQPRVCGFDSRILLRDSIGRWLDGAPGYGSGATSHGPHRMEDEYTMTAVAVLLALAELLRQEEDGDWLANYAAQIEREIERLRARDVDGDGLIESTIRRGVSGEHQWSTNWYDAISFGWKDAFTNALLFRAVRRLHQTLPALGYAQLCVGFSQWAAKIRRNYTPNFYNPKTGWLAGWRCAKNELHDYGFLFVNGAAVNAGLIPRARAHKMISRLWDELQKLKLEGYRYGLPGNVWPIPQSDVAAPLRNVPAGFFENGGLTHCQARHFVGALYRVGMTQEADEVLRGLCESLADASAFGGCGSDLDWRRRDGSPCGYEGLLTDQFGILAVALERYKRSIQPK